MLSYIIVDSGTLHFVAYSCLCNTNTIIAPCGTARSVGQKNWPPRYFVSFISKKYS